MTARNYTIKEGDMFGKWEVVSAEIVVKKSKAHLLCRCTCDKQTERYVYSYALRKGRSTHCGCGKPISNELLTADRVCSKCGNKKHHDEFSSYKSKICIECIKQWKTTYNKQYYTEHKEEIDARSSAYNKVWREENKERLSENSKKYHQEHRDIIKAQRKVYYRLNREKILAQSRKHYHTSYKHNSDAMMRRKSYNIQYKQKNKEKAREQAKARWKKSKLKYIEAHRAYHNNRRRTDIQYRIKCNIHGRISRVLRGISVEYSKSVLTGCSKAYLIEYLEQQFKPGMTWDNYGLKGWHVDHIKPLSLFDLTDETQVRQACHFTNLQPLWAEENLRKSNKYQG